MTIGKLCSREVDLADATESVAAAASRMNTRDVGTLIVLNEDRKPIGIVTDRDLTLRVMGQHLDPETTLVGDVLTPDPHTVSERTPIEDTLSSMRAHGVRRLPVVDADEHLVGVVSLDDIMELLFEEMGQLRGIFESTGPRKVALSGE